ncbi:MAG: hypothetical protein A3B99_04160 [Candidatus Yanofskybacteria bacterium RIFCSPHIGHO2_02_FULL_44_12b]|uniref:Methyltransferase type 11 domain-containing protein n=1 Tax=Candidatus Yanofskybacteria bacterium RIFCSPLOWO2_01_FULL_44_22 TaxID=1802697 RepID=A0A1F8GMY5_9BACT|nr:MAG: hypothetical protein A2659_00680 [Candidatus Yanofskybacteria bacterium RIFCSPHIGHO2_01_FULL_44_24]OGN15708.1 MAG: hypothetical protein A3B99_04160 [Candidatus Yanofskybacteria bacterium RIFCSPHIGHO2_02_FULL_44_12b]OGN26764.1 MAG: hypothetical protein A2925_04245 [Candidatus Yanofskybacteria bacterium RIFCSPLOWO2_01_FULL_44_22]
MVANELFEQKWSEALKGKKGEEFSIFVPKGKKPQTQRQFNLYYYYRLIERLIKGRNYKNSIEFGCGRGTISLYLNLYGGLDVTLFDVDQGGVDLARANFDLHRAKGSFFVADSAKVPIADDSFDIVVTMGLLEHLTNYIDSLKEMYRVLKPGGIMISMNVPKKTSIQILNKIYRKILGAVNKKIELKLDYFRIEETPAGFQRTAEFVGFKNCSIIHADPLPLFTPVAKPIERTLAVLYRNFMEFRKLFKSEPMETGRRLSRCHFLIGYK